MNTPDVERTAGELKRVFDATFAVPAVAAREAWVDLLAIRASDRQLAVRTEEAAGIAHCPPLTQLPSHNEALVGLAAVRGEMVGVYSIAALLGGARAERDAGWILLCAADRTAALWFDELIGYERLRESEIRAAKRGEGRDATATEVAHVGGASRAVLDVSGLLETISRTARTDTETE